MIVAIPVRYCRDMRPGLERDIGFLLKAVEQAVKEVERTGDLEALAVRRESWATHVQRAARQTPERTLDGLLFGSFSWLQTETPESLTTMLLAGLDDLRTNKAYERRISPHYSFSYLIYLPDDHEALLPCQLARVCLVDKYLEIE